MASSSTSCHPPATRVKGGSTKFSLDLQAGQSLLWRSNPTSTPILPHPPLIVRRGLKVGGVAKSVGSIATEKKRTPRRTHGHSCSSIPQPRTAGLPELQDLTTPCSVPLRLPPAEPEFRSYTVAI